MTSRTSLAGTGVENRTTWLTRLAVARLFYAQALAVELLYRFSLVQMFIGTAVSSTGLILFWLAAGRAAAQPGYTPAAIVAYFLFASAHTIVQESRVSWNLSAGIRMGKLAASLLRPYPFLVSVFCQAAAHATIRLTIIGVVFAGVFAGVPSLRAALPDLGAGWAAYAIVLALSLVIGWLTRIGIGLLAFDMTQTWGPELIFLSLYVAASGASYPPDLLPATVHTAITWTPFYYMIGFPVLVLMGRIDDHLFLLQLGRGGLVLAVTAAVVALMWRRGLKRFEAVGL